MRVVRFRPETIFPRYLPRYHPFSVTVGVVVVVVVEPEAGVGAIDVVLAVVKVLEPLSPVLLILVLLLVLLVVVVLRTGRGGHTEASRHVGAPSILRLQMQSTGERKREKKREI